MAGRFDSVILAIDEKKLRSVLPRLRRLTAAAITWNDQAMNHLREIARALG